MIKSLLAGICVCAVATGLKAQSVFFDTTFANSDWNSLLVSDTGSSAASFSAFQSSDAGNLVRSTTETYGASGGLIVGHYQNSLGWNPAIQGAVNTLNFSSDLRGIDFGTSAAVAYYAGVFQDNKFYVGPGYTLVSFGWVTATESALTSADFNNFDLAENPTGLHPDFSSNGSVIRFGYATSNGTAGGVTSTTSLLDNFSVTLQPVPEPGIMTLSWLGVGTLLASRRFRRVSAN